MATHSSILASKLPWTEEPGKLQSKGRKEMDWEIANACPPHLKRAVAACSYCGGQPRCGLLSWGLMTFFQEKPETRIFCEILGIFKVGNLGEMVKRVERYKLVFIRKINFPSSFFAAAAPNSLDFLLTISQFCGPFFTASLEHYSKQGRQGLSPPSSSRTFTQPCLPSTCMPHSSALWATLLPSWAAVQLCTLSLTALLPSRPSPSHTQLIRLVLSSSQATPPPGNLPWPPYDVSPYSLYPTQL